MNYVRYEVDSQQSELVYSLLPVDRLGDLKTFSTHTRFLATLRSVSRSSDYHSIIVFRLSPLASSHDDTGLVSKALLISPEQLQLYAMESTCPHLGAEMSHADIEDTETSFVAVCPWHRYDFDLRTGQSETGLKACTYSVQTRNLSESSENEVWLEAPGEGDWEVVELRPVSEGAFHVTTPFKEAL